MIPVYDKNPTARTPVLTIGLIVACVLVFLLQLSKPDDLSFDGRQAFICEYGLVPDNVLHAGDPPADGCQELNQRHPGPLGLLTSLFLHADWLHLGFNMLFLWVFGNNIEDRLGRIRFLPFYLLCGACAALAQAAAEPGSAVPLIGASGAISGVLGAYLVLYPKVRILSVVPFLFFIPFRVPAWLWLAIYFALQLLYLGNETTSGGGGVAYWAHIGGFLAGVLLIKPFLTGRDEPVPPAPAGGPASW